jgi:hypothetical protein
VERHTGRDRALGRGARRAEWGASFSYPRRATVLATSAKRALALPGLFFNELVRDAPTVDATIRAAVRVHLPRM